MTSFNKLQIIIFINLFLCGIYTVHFYFATIHYEENLVNCTLNIYVIISDYGSD